MPFLRAEIFRKNHCCHVGAAYAARGLPVSSRPPYTAGPGMPGPYACSNAKTGQTLRFQPVLVRLQELESWAL